MVRYLAVFLASLTLAGCATQAATSGRIVLQDDSTVADVRISDHDRRAIEDYYRKKRPPLSAKRGDNLPPGLRKRDKLPPGLQGEPLPAELERALAPLPGNYARVRVGQDIVLFDRRTRVVYDVMYGAAG